MASEVPGRFEHPDPRDLFWVKLFWHGAHSAVIDGRAYFFLFSDMSEPSDSGNCLFEPSEDNIWTLNE